MKLYPVRQLHREMAFIAYYFHWSREEIVSLTHSERAGWCEEISNIHAEQNRDDNFSSSGFGQGNPFSL